MSMSNIIPASSWLKTAILSLSLILTACGGSDNDDESNSGSTVVELEKPYLPILDPDNPNPNNISCNASVANEINWVAINNDVANFADNCEKLSDFNLFADASDPSQNINSNARVAPYDINTELFTDYTSKYRFVVMPEGVSADYMTNETFDFPVGTVLIKTFALPTDTQQRGIEFEEKIETRLLINRASGWVAIPYVWNADYSDAQRTSAPINLARTVTHNGEKLSFDYAIPGRDQCAVCHKITKDIIDPIGKTQTAGISPIGPKARNMNSDYDYGGTTLNQLTYWANNNLLTNLPALETVQKTPEFDSDVGLDSSDLALLQDTAKAYLDTNCAHCHRVEGKAKSTSLFFPYWLNYEGNEVAHGQCKTSLTSTKADTVIDLVPGDAEASLIHYRMGITSGEKMPELGRNLVHVEGLKLIKDWINALPAVACN